MPQHPTEQVTTPEPIEESLAVAVVESVVPTFAISASEHQTSVQEFVAFVKDQMVEGVDFGTIPGTNKPTLLKAGAEKLCWLFGLTIDEPSLDRKEEWDREPPLFAYLATQRLVDRRTGKVIATGVGACNSMESKYRYRAGGRSCPECGSESVIKGKEEYGGGWLCWKKKGGCGSKFDDGDGRIAAQAERAENPDTADVQNTILKMAAKRALVDATLKAVRGSGVFTQDIEDMGTIEQPAYEPAAAADAPRPTAPTPKGKQTAPAREWEPILRARMTANGLVTADLKVIIGSTATPAALDDWMQGSDTTPELAVDALISAALEAKPDAPKGAAE